MPRFALLLLARFAVIYGLAVWLCASVPVYAWIEAGATRVAAAALRGGAMQSRALALEPRDDSYVYVYDLRVGAVSKRLERPYHKHAFVFVVFLALVLATPGLRARERLVALLAGGGLVFLLGVAMLMSDVERWEREVLAAAGLALTRPFSVSLALVEGLHRTAAAGLLPVILWTFFAVWRIGPRGRTPPATSQP